LVRPAGASPGAAAAARLTYLCIVMMIVRVSRATAAPPRRIDRASGRVVPLPPAAAAPPASAAPKPVTPALKRTYEQAMQESTVRRSPRLLTAQRARAHAAYGGVVAAIPPAGSAKRSIPDFSCRADLGWTTVPGRFCRGRSANWKSSRLSASSRRGPWTAGCVPCVAESRLDFAALMALSDCGAQVAHVRDRRCLKVRATWASQSCARMY